MPEKTAKRPGCAEKSAQRAKLGGGEDASHPRALDGLANVIDLAHRQRAPLLECPCGLGRLSHHGARFFAGAGEGKRGGQLSPERPGAAVGQGGEHPVPLQIGAGLGRTGVDAQRIHEGG
jgi:hypothetical protein